MMKRKPRPVQKIQTNFAEKTVSHSSTAVRPLIVKPRDACSLLSCGITRLYNLLKDGELVSFLDGKSRKITTASIEAYIARRLEAAKGAQHGHL